jgi:hypothetical protein
MLRIRDVPVYPRSRILIFIHPGSRIPVIASRIQERKQKRRGEKIVIPPVPVPFLVATNISKLKIILEKKKKFEQIFEEL